MIKVRCPLYALKESRFVYSELNINLYKCGYCSLIFVSSLLMNNVYYLIYHFLIKIAFIISGINLAISLNISGRPR